MILQGFHEHKNSLQLPIHSPVDAVEAVHAAGHVDDQLESLGLFLRTSGFRILFASSFINRLFSRQTLNQLRLVEIAVCLGEREVTDIN